MQIHTEKQIINSIELTKVNLLLDHTFDQVVILCTNVSKVVATTSGSIKENEILITSQISQVSFYVEIKNTFIVTVNYYTSQAITHTETTELNTKEDTEQEHIPVVFTGNKGMNIFNKRIEKTLTDWTADITRKDDDLVINIVGHKTSLLLCLGLLTKYVTATDMTFVFYKDTKKACVPLDILQRRFCNKEIALHLLVKPDFQKTIKNIFYKTKVSNSIKVSDLTILKRHIIDFKTPLRSEFDPLRWVMDHNTQLPRFIA